MQFSSVDDSFHKAGVHHEEVKQIKQCINQCSS